jgi:hypothetical protein
MQITTIGLDIAKNVFQVHGVDLEENVVVRKPTSASAPIARAPSSAPESANNNSAKKKCRRRPAAAAPPSRPVQVGLPQSSLESAPPRARA